MTTHAQARNGAHVAVGMGAIMAVDVLHEFLADVGLELHRRVDGRVKIPTVLTIGAHDDDAIPIGQPMEVGLLAPVAVAAVGTMQQVYYRIAYVLSIIIDGEVRTLPTPWPRTSAEGECTRRNS